MVLRTLGPGWGQGGARVQEKEKEKEEDKDSYILSNSLTPKISSNTPARAIYGDAENVKLSEEELGKLKVKYKRHWPLILTEFSNAKAAKGYKYASDYRAILKWDWAKILATPAPMPKRVCERCGKEPMGTEGFCHWCTLESRAEKGDVSYFVEVV